MGTLPPPRFASPEIGGGTNFSPHKGGAGGKIRQVRYLKTGRALGRFLKAFFVHGLKFGNNKKPNVFTFGFLGGGGRIS